ncbi:MAG: porin [Deltaproteobacteria bacterium]|nr:porin [Deltaproteobacteria bacterium]
MKRGIALAVAFFALFTAGAASAKTLEELLKEKGVITEEDFRAVTRSRPVSYKPGEGFVFLSQDEKFRLSAGGSMQFRYTFTDKDDVNGTQQDTSEWRMRRVKLSLGGHAYTKELTYKLVMNFVEANTGKLMEDAYASYRFRDEFQVLAGQGKVPFSRQELTSTNGLQFVDRSVAVDAFKPSYDIGVLLHGNALGGTVAYHAGVFGGVGQNTLRTTTNNLLAARFSFSPFGEVKYVEGDFDESPKPLFSVGIDYFRDALKLTKGTTDVLETNNLSFAGSSGWLGKGLGTFQVSEKLDIDSGSVDAVFKWKGFSLQGEFLAAQAEGQASGILLRAQAFYVEAGFMVLPRQLEAAVRYSYLDPNRGRANDLQVDSQGVLSYFFSGHNLKLQGDYTNVHKQVAGKQSTDDRQVRLQAQILF